MSSLNRDSLTWSNFFVSSLQPRSNIASMTCATKNMFRSAQNCCGTNISRIDPLRNDCYCCITVFTVVQQLVQKGTWAFVKPAASANGYIACQPRGSCWSTQKSNAPAFPRAFGACSAGLCAHATGEGARAMVPRFLWSSRATSAETPAVMRSFSCRYALTKVAHCSCSKRRGGRVRGGTRDMSTMVATVILLRNEHFRSGTQF